MDNEGPVETGIKRRSLIKRAGIVGAGVAAWSSPTVTSLASRAYAGSAPSSCKACDYFPICGQSPGSVDGTCYCYHQKSGGCACAINAYCADVQPCSSQSDCPSGTVCTTGSSCGYDVCIPNCDNTNGAYVGSGSGQKTGPS